MSERWDEFVAQCRRCKACGLAETRRNVVVSRGAVRAPLVLIGEGPGADEDAQGLPFVGRSGKLLNHLLIAHGFSESDYHICNIVKCRPPGNRKPTREEAEACAPLLAEQLERVGPKVALLLGATAYLYFTGREDSISAARGHFIEEKGLAIMPSFHPAYILRNNNMRIHLWHDLSAVRARLEAMGLLTPLRFTPEMPSGRP